MDATGTGARDRPTDVRAALLDAAEVEVGERGGGKLSLRAVARRANVSHQAPAHFFVNRMGLLTALASRGTERLRCALIDTVAAAEGQDPLVRLADLGMTYVDFAVVNRGLFVLASSPAQIDIRDPELTRVRRAAWDVLADTVAEAQRDGWRTDQDTDIVAMLCWSMVHGSAGLWRDGWLEFQHGDEARRAIRKMLTTIL